MPGNNKTPAGSANITFGQFTHYLSSTHRKQTREDTTEAVEKISVRLDATQQEFTAHKVHAGEEMPKIRQCIERLSNEKSQSIAGSYAAASSWKCHGTKKGTTNMQSQEVRSYWEFRRCAKIHQILGETEAELWRSLQDFLRT